MLQHIKQRSFVFYQDMATATKNETAIRRALTSQLHDTLCQTNASELQTEILQKPWDPCCDSLVRLGCHQNRSRGEDGRPSEVDVTDPMAVQPTTTAGRTIEARVQAHFAAQHKDTRSKRPA